jgi:serine/threonine protein kinase
VRTSPESKLTPQQRLELFGPVCQAIPHAHHKGIIHRDLKPSNVLVALYDDKPVPKVIDFGVAKATGQALTQRTLNTGFGAVVGTPQYMSPGQATLNNLDIDTRSDADSLGVLLYELLAGSPPFNKKELEKVGMLEILRVIRAEEPPRPSTRLSTADALPSFTGPRRITWCEGRAAMGSSWPWPCWGSVEKRWWERSRCWSSTTRSSLSALRSRPQKWPPGCGARCSTPWLPCSIRFRWRSMSHGPGAGE